MIKKLFLPVSSLCFLLFFSCKHPNNISPASFQGRVDEHWVNWNIVFTPASVEDTASILSQFEDSLRKYITSKNSSAKLVFNYHHCPCDSLLTNMDATAIYPSGNPVPPPPTKPPIGPSGDFTVGENRFAVYVPEFKDSLRSDSPSKYTAPVRFVSDTPGSRLYKVLAVIDTGLDTVRFKMGYPNTIWSGNLLWSDATRKKTIYDVVIGEDTNLLRDQTPAKHGTAVTEIVLRKLFESNRQLPQIMSIRAFNDSEQGSIYTVSCALSYAIQNNVDFINASWGYFGEMDSVLYKYLLKADAKNIRVIAAAGNTPTSHNFGMICSNLPNTQNDLDRLQGRDSLFYPAAFESTITNLVSVTQLHLLSGVGTNLNLIPCYYQNFSKNFVTVGAYQPGAATTGLCCTFDTRIVRDPIEGSSFATPVITAILMNSLPSRTTNVKNFINANAGKSTNTRFTLEGNYIEFHQLP